MKERIVEIWDEHSVVGAIILIVLMVIGAFAGYFGVMCLKAWIVMLLWNWIAVGLFGAPVLGFWVAFGLRLLCSLLFKGVVTVEKKSE